MPTVKFDRQSIYLSGCLNLACRRRPMPCFQVFCVFTLAIKAVLLSLPFTGCQLTGCLFTGCLFTGCLFTGCLFNGCLFSGCLFSGCLFTGCLFTGCLFADRECRPSNSTIWSADRSNSTIWFSDRQIRGFGVQTITFDDFECPPSNSMIGSADLQLAMLFGSMTLCIKNV